MNHLIADGKTKNFPSVFSATYSKMYALCYNDDLKKRLKLIEEIKLKGELYEKNSDIQQYVSIRKSSYIWDIC